MTACRNIAESGRGPAARQRGVGLLVILIIAGVLGVVFVTTVVGSAPDDMARDRATQAALARAKEALISYAVTYMESHPTDMLGYLPCPEQSTSVREGAALGTCGVGYSGGTTGDNILGRLPWYTLGIEPLRDGYGECLWYAVSATYKNNPEPGILNWDSAGRFQIVGPDGSTLLAGATDPDLVVAVVIAPGPAFGGQTRADGTPATPTCGGNLAAGNYLDAVGTGGSLVDNANPSTNAATGKGRFIQGARSSTFNDRLIYITAADIWNAVIRRTDLQARLNLLTQRVAFCIASYPTVGASNDRRLPWAVTLPQVGYTSATDYTDGNNVTFGRAPYVVDTSNGLTGFGNNTLLLSWPGGRCVGWSAYDDKWYKHWKDHLFLGLSTRFEPDDGGGNSCSGNCLEVNNNEDYAAAVVLFAGRSTTGQPRATDALKASAANYFAAENADGDKEYITPTAPFSLLYCINPVSTVTSPAPGALPTSPPPPAPKFWVHPC